MKCIRNVALLLALAAAIPALAQTKPATPPAAPPGPAGFDPAAIRERIMASMKTTLNCTDDEWKVIEPKLIKIVLLKMDTGALGSFNRPGRGGTSMSTFIRQILDPNALPSSADEKLSELQALFDQNETSTDAYKNKVAQLRAARAKAKEALDAAEKDVTSILTIRQEAALVQLGVLD